MIADLPAISLRDRVTLHLLDEEIAKQTAALRTDYDRYGDLEDAAFDLFRERLRAPLPLDTVFTRHRDGVSDSPIGYAVTFHVDGLHFKVLFVQDTEDREAYVDGEWKPVKVTVYKPELRVETGPAAGNWGTVDSMAKLVSYFKAGRL